MSYGRIKEGVGRFSRENIINWSGQLSDTQWLRKSQIANVLEKLMKILGIRKSFTCYRQ